MVLLYLLTAINCLLFSVVAEPEETTSYQTFLTRPDARIAPLKLVVNHLDDTSDSFIFLCTWHSVREGAYIYNARGDLIWDGTPGPDAIKYEWSIFNAHPIELNGTSHLLYTTQPWDAWHPNPRNTSAVNLRGSNVILNNKYEPVKIFEPPAQGYVNAHEFQVVNNGSTMWRVLTSIIPCSQDLLCWGKFDKVATDSLQVMDIATGSLIWEWHGIDHVGLDESCIPDLTDYMHINSFDQDIDGNYIIGGFHTCTVYKINSEDGSIMWRLGGARSDFRMEDGYVLNYMHHIRVRKLSDIQILSDLNDTAISDKTHLALSIFDNAFNFLGHSTAPSTAAVVILLNLETMTGRVIERYPHPEGRYAPIFGAFSFQPNGNRFIAWGGDAAVSEFDQNGTLLYHARHDAGPEMIRSYRAYKGPFSAQPHTVPDVLSYSWTCTWSTMVYVSWNGATTVKSWKVTGSRNETGPFSILATIQKVGFETSYALNKFVPFVEIEALDSSGNTLARSNVTRTRVPDHAHMRRCNSLRCPAEIDYSTIDVSETCQQNQAATPHVEAKEQQQQKIL